MVAFRVPPRQNRPERTKDCLLLLRFHASRAMTARRHHLASFKFKGFDY